MGLGSQSGNKGFWLLVSEVVSANVGELHPSAAQVNQHGWVVSTGTEARKLSIWIADLKLGKYPHRSHQRVTSKEILGIL